MAYTQLRALNRHLSTTSTSSFCLSQSAVSSSQLTSSSGAGSTEISSPSSSSYNQPATTAAALSVSASSSSSSRIEPPSSFLEEKDMPSLPLVLEKEWQEGSFDAAARNNNNNNNNINNNQSSEHRFKDDKRKGATTIFVSALDRTEQEGNILPNHSSNHKERSRSRSPSCVSPSIGDDDDAPAAMASAASAVTAANAAATVSSGRPNQHNQQQQTSTLPSPSSSQSLSVPVSVSLSFSSHSSSSVAIAPAQHGQQARQQQQQSGSNNNHNSKKVNKSSIAALLSVTLTMILLSLLQSKKRHLRRKSRSPRGTTSKRHSRRGSRQLLLAQQQQHREGYKSTSTDHLTPRSHSPSSSSNTNYNNSSSNNIDFLLTDDNNNNSNINMEGTSSLAPEGKRSSLLLTQYRPASFFGGGHGGEPTSAAYHNHHSIPLSAHGHHIHSDPHNNNSLPNLLPSSPSNPSYPPNSLHFDPTTPLLHQGNMYSGRDISYSLSDTNLPDKQSKRDLVADWLDRQTFVTPSDMVEAPEHLPLVQDSPNANIVDDNESLHQLHHHHIAHHYQQQQQQQLQRRRKSFPAQSDTIQLYHQQSINNTGAQREPRQLQQGQQGQGQEHYPRVIQRTNEQYPGSRSSLYISSSASRHSMVALDQQLPQLTPRLSQQQQQQQQQSSSPSFWRESQSHLQFQQQQQFSPHQYPPHYQHYPQQQHLPHQQHSHPAHYGHYQQQYPQAPVSPAYRPSYEPLGYEDLDQQDANHRRSLSLNNSGGRRRRAGSRPQSQVYRKATPAKFENLSLAEQARQEHQMRRQHYQQHYHQHRQQQQQQQQLHHQHQHQQYYQTPGSRPQSMYSNGYGAAASPREVSQFVPSRHHQAHPRPHLPSIVTHQQQHHPSIVSSPKTSNVCRSAHDLAWERHCYYQQQQMQEDALAERKRIEQQQQAQQQKRAQRPLSSVEGGLQVPLLQGSSTSVVRTSSMSRVSSISTTAVTGGNAASTIGRRTAVGKVALGSSGLSRSVSTSAVLDAKARAAKKDKSSQPILKRSGKESPTTETETKSSTMDCKFLRLFRSDSKLSAKKTVPANAESPSASTQAQTASSKERSTVPVIVTIQPLDSNTPAPSPAAATTELNRRRTLKDLAPSIRSLARRCSSRFSSNNSSSRPSSFAGSSSDPVIQPAEGKALGGGSSSLSMTTSYLPLKLSLSSLPRSLAPGPDGIVDLQQAASPSSSSPLSTKHLAPASASTPSLSLSDMPPSPPPQQEQEQRVPIHRKVTLFRSKTLSLAKSSLRFNSPPLPTSHADNTTDMTPSNGMPTADDHDDDNNNNNNRNSSTRANSLPSRRRRQRDSLRLANGHGLDFDTFLPSTTTSSNVTMSTSAEDEASVVEKSTNDLESALPGAGLGRSTGTPILPAIVTTGGRPADVQQQQKARRQIISLLAMGRKDRISAKTGYAMKSGSSSTASSPTTPTTASTTATSLTQLSPLALEAQEDLFVSPADAGEKGEEEDPCEKIAFMLVPKSRYEFQPLVVA